MKAIVTVFATILLLATHALAQAQTDPIRQFINESTVGVARINFTKVDFDALDRWADSVIAQAMPADQRAESSKPIHASIASARQWAEQFTKAGGKSVWGVLTLEHLRGTPVYLVVPIEAGANAESLKGMLSMNGSSAVAQVGTNFLVAPDASLLEDLKKIRPSDRPEFEKAFAAGDARNELIVALAASADSKKVMETMVPKLPNGQPSGPLTRDISWASLSLNVPPSAVGHILIQTSDPNAAQNLRKTLADLLPAQNVGNAGKASPAAALLATAGVLVQKSQVQQDRLVIDLQGDLTNQLASRLSDGVIAARESARRMQAVNQIKQLMLACISSASNDKQNQYPATMEEAIKAMDVGNQLLVNPRQPGEKVGFVYVRPGDGIKADFMRLVIYEKFTQWDGGISVGFADGHVEFVSDQARFQQLLDTAKQKAAK